MGMKNSYLDKFKKETFKEEKKQTTAYDKCFEMEDESLADVADYCKKCKRESRWCKHRVVKSEHKHAL